jgi:periplasmic protein CpxP/Spy
MKSFRFRLLVAAMAVLLGTAIAKSQTSDEAPPPPARHMHAHGYGMHHPMMGFFAKQLNLSDAQKAQMKSILQKEHPAMKPLFQQSHQIDVELRQYVEGNYDEAKVRALAAQKAQVESEMTVERTRIHSELYQLLSSDQQAKLKEIEARHEARIEQHLKEASNPPSEP